MFDTMSLSSALMMSKLGVSDKCCFFFHFGEYSLSSYHILVFTVRDSELMDNVEDSVSLMLL